MPTSSLSFIFGDNMIVVDSVMTPHDKILESNVALSFHRVRESIASKIVNYILIYGKNSLADVLIKYWDHNDVLPILKPILFWPGDTM